jgi:hypothetical protein
MGALALAADTGHTLMRSIGTGFFARRRGRRFDATGTGSASAFVSVSAPSGGGRACKTEDCMKIETYARLENEM